MHSTWSMGDGLCEGGQNHWTEHRAGETFHWTVDRWTRQGLVRTRDIYLITTSTGFRSSLRYPLGKDLPVDLSAALTARDTTRICVTEEQYSIYGAIDTSFELCKICSVNNKDSRIEPCGHFICRSCLTSWQVMISEVMDRHLSSRLLEAEEWSVTGSLSILSVWNQMLRVGDHRTVPTLDVAWQQHHWCKA